jgi:spore germination protein GerM
MRRRGALAWSLALLVLVGCGVPTDDAARRISPNRLPDALRPAGSTTTTLVVAMANVEVYFVRNGRLVPVEHEVEAPTTPTKAVAALTAGPAQDDPTGLRSAIPDAQVIVDVDVQAGTATVELSDAFDQVQTPDQALAIGQLVLTLTHLRGVGQVRFDLGGTSVAVPLPDGKTAAVVSADDYRELIEA